MEAVNRDLSLGVDIGSTTVKMVLVDRESGKVVMDAYRRHQARVLECLDEFVSEIGDALPSGADTVLSVCLTGSIGMGVAGRLSLPFVQEVVAAAGFMKSRYPDVPTLMDIGGEDAKVVFFSDAAPDLRMNGNCAGGTGAFIDQMALLLDVSPEELGALAEKSTMIYPMASRCGVFCKTDVQNLIARNVPREDIAASIFHAVAVQTVTTLAHGHEISAPVLLCGGPLTFIPALRKAFSDYLGIPEEQFILSPKGNLVPAWGTALSGYGEDIQLSELRSRIAACRSDMTASGEQSLPPIFHDASEYEAWRKDKSARAIERGNWRKVLVPVAIGIDSGSTTTKLVALDTEGRLLFSRYADNDGNPVQAVRQALEALQKTAGENGAELQIVASCSTGYGEDLIKAAFHLNGGIVETMAHYVAARQINPSVSFILDIGGQDMKAIFVKNGAICRIEVNEACSSGCGSFLSTFARSLGCTVGDFAQMACLAPSPCDLGTRCTVFMNSKVKQALSEGAQVENIAAGLSYSVIKNCLYKVLRLKDSSELGDCFVVQGGTMRNDSVVKALENLTGKKAYRSDSPELMGAYGCALHALENRQDVPASLETLLSGAEYTSSLLHCKGCVNSCSVTRYRFGNGNVYYSGNRCEKVFSGRGADVSEGMNAYQEKRRLLFERESVLTNPLLTVGIPRCLGMYEEYPFWHKLFTLCNIRVVLSDVSTFGGYERCASYVMSDNICFPAKIAHSHIENLQQRGVDRIFMPFVLYGKRDPQMQNSYNCPVVTGYSQVVRSVQSGTVPIDTPTVSFRDRESLFRECRKYLVSLGVDSSLVRKAVDEALAEQERYEKEIGELNGRILARSREDGRLAVVLSGRPYHADSLVQHKVSEMIASLGVNVLSDEIVCRKRLDMPQYNFLSQWVFPDRIMKSAAFVAAEDAGVQFVQMTSFGCGPDAFLTDEVRKVLELGGKNLTLLKIDDVDNIGSLKLRVRSLIESLRVSEGSMQHSVHKPLSLPVYTEEQRRKKIIIPFFTPFISPLIPPILKTIGYDVETLPLSDADSCSWGLKYSNNEICYPATLVVGDIVRAFRSGRYDPNETCVAMTQTGGQCRASNYLSLIRKALLENGYVNTPVISVTFGGGIKNVQPGFKVNWLKVLPAALRAILFGDVLARLYYASLVRETVEGEASRLKDMYLEKAARLVEVGESEALYLLLEKAVVDFGGICRDEEHPRVGVVGEIYLKFHPFAQKHVTDYLVSQGVEIVYPSLADFFVQSFVNTKDRKDTDVDFRHVPDFAIRMAYSLVKRDVEKVNRIGSRFAHYVPLDDIFEKAELAEGAVTLSAQFGEGWLIAGEVGSLAKAGVTHVVSLQPFGCIANHIVGKGIENRLKKMYPQINMLSLDFDSSVSEVNIKNRLLLFIDSLENGVADK